MLEIQVGKREHNKVIQKMKILDGFLKAMSHHPLHTLRIEDVCGDIGVSKVTFFNYFKSKEEVVEYFIQLWQFEMAYEIGEENLKGKRAITLLFDRVSEHPAGQEIMNALMAFFVKVRCYVPTEVSDYELYTYNKQAYLAGYRSKPLFLILSDATKDLPISAEEEKTFVMNVVSGFYGIPFVVGLGFGQELKEAYHSFLQAIMPERGGFNE